MIKIKLKLLLPLLFTCAVLSAQAQTSSDNFKIVGYYSIRAALTADLSTVPFDKLTHINLYFLNPDTLGNFNTDLTNILPFIKAAHAKNVKVLPSIAGGSRHTYYHALLMDDKRPTFIKALVDVAVKYGFDGIDVDIEGADIDENYEKFATELSAALKAKKLLTTAAIAIFYKDQLTEAALAQYDFVTLMSYDHTSPGRPDRPGPHSPYDKAVADLDYFYTVKKVPKNKIVLGVGFYGYGFGPDLTTPGMSMTYKQLVTQYPGAQLVDEWALPGGKTIYYNGIPTIKQKTQLAQKEASGIMIWQLLGDADGDRSLLNAIYQQAYKK
ncbi:MAG: glycosyl hydrolase family 18 protein [Bacteroidota bacterium]